MEFIVNEKGRFLIDINPRFSAGIGFSRLIGYDLVNNALNCFLGRNIKQIKSFKHCIAEKVIVEKVNIDLD